MGLVQHTIQRLFAYLQSKLMSSGYQFMTIVLDIGSTETASAVRVTWKIICWVMTRFGRFCGHTSGKNISSRLVMGASNWRGFTLICKAVITKMIRQDATRAAQYKENLRRPRRILLWSIVELLYCRQSQWLLIKRVEKDQYNQTLVLYVYTVCLNCYAR